MVGAPDMRIEVGPVAELRPRDTLLLASDGLFDNLHQDEIIERIRKGALTDALRRLTKDAQARMAAPDEAHPSKPDDLTVLLYRPRPLSR
jgi:serine/threonine protein phosphatase PrpC